MKSFDITAPSRVNPSANSRPVIVGHRPIMADPMMRPAAPNPAAAQADQSPVIASPTPAMTTHVAKVIEVTQEVKDDLMASQPAPAPTPAPPIAAASFPAVPQVEAQASPQAPSTPVTPATTEEIPGAQPQMPIAPSHDSPDAPAATAEQLPQVPEQDLSHIPHVPVSHRHRRRGGLKNILLWLLIIGFLAGLAAYLLIDAGLIASSINLPFHIFSTQ